MQDQRHPEPCAIPLLVLKDSGGLHKNSQKIFVESPYFSRTGIGLSPGVLGQEQYQPAEGVTCGWEAQTSVTLEVWEVLQLRGNTSTSE